MTLSETEKRDRVIGMLERLSPHGSLGLLQEELQSLSDDENATGELLSSRRRDFDVGESFSMIERGRADRLDSTQLEKLEAVIHETLRPAIYIVNNKFGRLPAYWHELDKQEARLRIERCIPSIGRIELPGKALLPYAGTGFVVGHNLMMTNRHVATIFAKGTGLSEFQFKSGYSAAINFRRERIPTNSKLLRVIGVRMAHPIWDMALLEVEGLTELQPPLRLSVMHPNELTSRKVVVIGYPQQDIRGDIAVQNRIFEGMFGVKRLLPGRIGSFQEFEEGGQIVQALTHDASTLGGSSGSAIIHVDSGEVIALHFAGEYLKTNFAVATQDLLNDPQVEKASLNFVADLLPMANEIAQTARHAVPQGKMRIGESRNSLKNELDKPVAATTKDCHRKKRTLKAQIAYVGSRLWSLPKSTFSEVFAALTPFTIESDLQKTAWYIESHFADASPQSGAGVLVRIDSDGVASNFLLTCQHVLRNEDTCQYSDDIRCWCHGDGYNPGRYWKASVCSISGSDFIDEDNAYKAKSVGGQDWVLLKVAKDNNDANLLPYAPGFSGIHFFKQRFRLLGFPGGNSTMERSVVEADICRDFQISPVAGNTGTLLLSGEETTFGYSGGPYLRSDGRIIALHRSVRRGREKPVGVDGVAIALKLKDKNLKVVEQRNNAAIRSLIRACAALVCMILFALGARPPELSIDAIAGKPISRRLSSTELKMVASTNPESDPQIVKGEFYWENPVFHARGKADSEGSRFISHSTFYYRHSSLGIPWPTGKINVRVRAHRTFASVEDFYETLSEEDENTRKEWYEDMTNKPLISIAFENPDTKPEISNSSILAEKTCDGCRVELNLLLGRHSIVPDGNNLLLDKARKFEFKDVFLLNGDERNNLIFNENRWSLYLVYAQSAQ
jgi:Trypsin-like peptidase domain